MCSSDLHQLSLVPAVADYRYGPLPLKSFLMLVNVRLCFVWRSEERRVGKECGERVMAESEGKRVYRESE